MAPRHAAAVGPLACALALAWPGAARGGEPLDGRQLVKGYRDAIESYRHHDPNSSGEGYQVVLKAARWDLDLARLAAKLAVMPPPNATVVVRLDGDDRHETSRAGPDRGAGASGSRAGSVRNDDALERALAANASGLAAREWAPEAAASGVSPSARVDPTPPSPVATDAQAAEDTKTSGEEPRPAPNRETGPQGACLISRFADGCAEALKAAALLHTDVATLELGRGEHARAAAHRAIAGWLLWHLPRRAQDDSFVRNWLLAVGVLLRGDGSLSSARQLGQLGLTRFPKDEALLLSTASAMEALATLCYQSDGKPLRSEDCFEIPVAFDASQPERPLVRDARPLDRGRVLREAEGLLREAAALRPADAEVHLRLGHVLAQRGQPKEAQAELSWVIDRATDASHVALAHLLLGRLAETRKDAQGALEQARAAETAAPSSQSARVALAYALLTQGQRRDALTVMAALPNEPSKTRDPWAELLLGSTAGYGPARAALYAGVRLP